MEFEKQRERRRSEVCMKDEELRMKMELDRLKIEAELDAAAAEEETYTKLLDECGSQQGLKMTSKVDGNIPRTDSTSQGPRIAAGMDDDLARTNIAPVLDKPQQIVTEDNISRTVIRTDMQGQGQCLSKGQDIAKASILNPCAAEWQSVGVQGTPRDPPFLSEPQDKVSVHGVSAEGQTGLQQSLLDAISLPKTTLMKFDGDPMKFWVFMNAFDSCVGTSQVADGVKLNRLQEYCTGKAAKVILPCALMHPSEGYARARSLLSEKFGNDYQISESWIHKVTEGSAIRPNNGEDIQDLADDLRTETLKAMERQNDIDSRVRMVKIVDRLPVYLQSRWRKEAVATLRYSGRYPNIEKLVEFLSKVADEVNDPVFGLTFDRQKNKAFQEKFQKFRSN